jgi:DNA polymerase III alpha subunit
MAIDGIGDAANAAVLKGQPYTSFEDFLERKGEKCNKGHIRKLVKLGVFDTLVPNRRGLEQLLDEDDLPAAQRCQSYSETVNDVGLPCVYDWANEPPEIGRSNKPKKPKPPPKKCTRACRQFNMRDPLDPLSVTPYTDADVRKIEIDTLGVFLSSTPFDRISAEDRETLATATDVLSGPPGAYVIACLLKSIRKREGRDGRMYAFLTLTTEMGELDCICFSKYLEKYESQMLIGGLALVGLTKNDRGQALDLYCSLEQ